MASFTGDAGASPICGICETAEVCNHCITLHQCEATTTNLNTPGILKIGIQMTEFDPGRVCIPPRVPLRSPYPHQSKSSDFRADQNSS
jgi:hypothetical protein